MREARGRSRARTDSLRARLRAKFGSESHTLRQKIRQVSTCRIFLSIAKAMVYHHDAVVDIITEGVYHQP